MTTQTRDTDAGRTETDLSAELILQLLSHTRRRYALHYLVQKVGAVHLGEIAEQIAIWEEEPTRDRYERIYVGLLHAHVPKLSDAGVVRYHEDDETVSLSESADRLRPYLDLAARDDLR